MLHPLCQGTFDELKVLLTKAPVLAFPGFKVPFILHQEVVWGQQQDDGSTRPVVFSSRTLQPVE